jgi:hypothetical protein
MTLLVAEEIKSGNINIFTDFPKESTRWIIPEEQKELINWFKRNRPELFK